MDNLNVVLNIVAFFLLIALAVFMFVLFDYFRFTKGTRINELLGIWAVAVVGSIAGSLLIGIVGVILSIVLYPNTDEWGAALVGGMFGSCISVPLGIAVGGFVGTIIVDFLLHLNARHPALIASIAAFLIGAPASGMILVPVGFIFYGLGHI